MHLKKPYSSLATTGKSKMIIPNTNINELREINLEIMQIDCRQIKWYK